VGFGESKGGKFLIEKKKKDPRPETWRKSRLGGGFFGKKGHTPTKKKSSLKGGTHHYREKWEDQFPWGKKKKKRMVETIGMWTPEKKKKKLPDLVKKRLRNSLLKREKGESSGILMPPKKRGKNTNGGKKGMWGDTLAPLEKFRKKGRKRHAERKGKKSNSIKG